MSTATVPVIKKRGNPAWGKKTTEITEQELNIENINKQYIFQLIKTHEKTKPVDHETGQLLESPFQPYYGIPNSGLAWDPDYITPNEAKKPKGEQKKGATRRWRYLYNYPTIWVDEQIDPEPTKEEIGDEKNDLIFRKGVLRVFGHEEMKLKAIMLYNGFADCVRPLKNVPKEYVLLDQEKIDKEVLKALDDSFEAEKSARESTLQEMYAIAYYFGLDLSKSDDAIRKEFIGIARSKPAVFNREFVNPKNKVKYAVLEALADNYISDTIIPMTLHFVESSAKIMDLKTPDTAEEVSSLYMSGNEKAINLYNKINKHFEGGE